MNRHLHFIILVLIFTNNVKAQDTIGIDGLKDTAEYHKTYVNPSENTSVYLSFPATNFTSKLEGRVAGLQATNINGQPSSAASFIIRGVNPDNSATAPLILVDGLPYYGDVNAIAVEDIESINVLKDPIESMQYIGQAHNGVISVITKNADRVKKWGLTVDANVGVITPAIADYATIKDEKTYYELSWQAYRNMLHYLLGLNMDEAGKMASGVVSGSVYGIVQQLGGYNSYNVADNDLIDPSTGQLNPNASLRYHDDWKKETQRTALRHQYQLNIMNGGNVGNLYVSAGYLKENGYNKSTNYERFSSRINSNIHYRDWLRAGINLSGILANSSSNLNNCIDYNRYMAPIYPVYFYNDAGEREAEPIIDGDKLDWGSTSDAPKSSIGNRPIFGNTNIVGEMLLDDNNNKNTNLLAIPYVELSFLKQMKFRTDFSYNYNKSDKIIRLNPFYGQFATNPYSEQSIQKMNRWTWRQLLQWKKTFHQTHNIDVNVGNMIGGIHTEMKIDAIINKNSIMYSSATDKYTFRSTFANVSYNYKERYYASGGYSWNSVSPNQKSYKAWVAGLQWIVSNEAFIKNADLLSLLKIKYSYAAIHDNPIYYGVNRNAPLSSLGNTNYDANKQWLAGAEIGFMQNRIYLDVNYFDKQNGYVIPYPNIGGLITYVPGMLIGNKGWEFTLSTEPVKTDKIIWNLSFNYTTYKNKIVSMPDRVDSFIASNYLWTKGNSIYDFNMVENAGVDNTNGDELYYYNNNGVKKATTNYSLAMSQGNTNIGSALPKGFGAVNNSISIKNFTATLLFTFSVGGKYYDNTYRQLMTSNIGQNYSTDILNSWTPQNTTSDIPRMEYNNLGIANRSTRFVTSASWANFKYASVAYTFNHKKLQALKLRGLTVYASADNICFFSKRKGMNPQSNFVGIADDSYYPSRLINVGLQVKL